MKISKSITKQNFITRYIEILIRSHPLIYIISKRILTYTSIFEDEMRGVEYLNFNKKKSII